MVQRETAEKRGAQLEVEAMIRATTRIANYRCVLTCKRFDLAAGV